MQNHSFVPSKLFRLVFVSILVIVFSQSFAFSQYLLPSVLDEQGNSVQLHFPPADSNYIHNEIINLFQTHRIKIGQSLLLFTCSYYR